MYSNYHKAGVYVFTCVYYSVNTFKDGDGFSSGLLQRVFMFLSYDITDVELLPQTSE